MANKPREQVRREMDLISEYMYGKPTLSDPEIIKQLQIPERTFRRYKSRVRKEYAKQWENESKDNARYAYAEFNRTLEYCYRETKKIIENPHSRPMERIEAIKTLDVLAAQIAKLAKDGPIFTPQLPNKVIPITDAREEVTV